MSDWRFWIIPAALLLLGVPLMVAFLPRRCRPCDRRFNDSFAYANHLRRYHRPE